MNLNAEDLKAIKSIVSETVDDKLRIQSDLLRQETRASEHRIKTEIIAGVTDFIDDNLLPNIQDHEDRLIKLESKETTSHASR